MLKKFLSDLLYSYILAILIALLINIKTISQMSNEEFLKVTLVGSLLITPIVSLLIYAIKFAGVLLVNDFIEGNILNKIVILAIVVTLYIMKFMN